MSLLLLLSMKEDLYNKNITCSVDNKYIDVIESIDKIRLNITAAIAGTFHNLDNS